MTQIERRQTWRQKKDQTLVAIRDVGAGAAQPVIYFYNVDGPRRQRDFRMAEDEFLSKFTREFTPDELDAEWRRMSNEENNDAARYVAAEFDQIAEAYEIKLRELRILAKASLEKGMK